METILEHIVDIVCLWSGNKFTFLLIRVPFVESVQPVA